MLQRYRILHAILTLREFTVTDLSRFSGVKDTTVRTVLGREARFVERDGIRALGGRGGQPILYRLREDAESDLIAILRELDSVGAGRARLAEDQENPVLMSLIAAEDVLLRQVPLATQDERAQLVKLATADYQAARLAAKSGDVEVVTHGRVVDLLLRLTEIEQAALRWPTPGLNDRQADLAAKKLQELGRDWRNLLASWPALSDQDLLPNLVHRIATSWIGAAILASAEAAMDTGQGTGKAIASDRSSLQQTSPARPWVLYSKSKSILLTASEAGRHRQTGIVTYRTTVRRLSGNAGQVTAADPSFGRYSGKADQVTAADPSFGRLPGKTGQVTAADITRERLARSQLERRRAKPAAADKPGT